MLRLVVFESIEQEAGRWCDHILAHEDIDYALNVDKRAGFLIDKLAGKFGALLWVRAHYVL